MLNFTSGLYLGLRHASRSLRPWPQLTSGAPAVLVSPSGADRAAYRLAALQGCEGAILAPSTLHLFWDLFGILARGSVSIFMSRCTYPIARWGVERALSQGVRVRSFHHYDPDILRRALKRNLRCGFRPVVVSDGYCPGCGKPAPIAEYLDSIRPFGGLLVLDDTQALGILGLDSKPDVPYGKGGGGILRWSNLSGPDVLIVTSLAKGFGVPVAALSGSRGMIRMFKGESETRVHCSPPSVSVIRAAQHALERNEKDGDERRFYLSRLVHRFRHRLKEIGLFSTGGLFPVQTLHPIPGVDARVLHQRLSRLGVRAVPHHGRAGRDARVGFLITTRHSEHEIDQTVDLLNDAANRTI